jgi:NAD(P)-dependent dehydrogenase (short-subunit alcohol dehydrogenase family)
MAIFGHDGAHDVMNKPDKGEEHEIIYSHPIATQSQITMGTASHGFALVTPASRGIGFAFAQQLLARTTLPVVATARINCSEVRDRLLSTELPSGAEERLRIFEVDVKGRPLSQIPTLQVHLNEHAQMNLPFHQWQRLYTTNYRIHHSASL